MYLYSFSTLSFGIGIGYFCTALALYLFCKQTGNKVYLAILPATFAIAIYQPFIIVVISVFLIHLVNAGIQNLKDTYKILFRLIIVVVGSLFLYIVIQFLISAFANIDVWNYLGLKF